MTCEECPHAIDTMLVDIASKLGGLTNDVARVQRHVEGLRGNVVEIRELLASQQERVGDHTTRIATLETNGTAQKEWRAKLGGVWMAVAIGAGVVATLAALAVSLFK